MSTGQGHPRRLSEPQLRSIVVRKIRLLDGGRLGLQVILDPAQLDPWPPVEVDQRVAGPRITVLRAAHAADVHEQRAGNPFLVGEVGMAEEQHIAAGELSDSLECGSRPVCVQVLVNPPRAAVHQEQPRREIIKPDLQGQRL